MITNRNVIILGRALLAIVLLAALNTGPAQASLDSAPAPLPGDGDWETLGNGLGSSVNALAFGNSGLLYAGGNFTTAGGNTAKYIAKWDGSGWTPVGGGVTLTVRGFAVNSTGTLYVGGDFDKAGGITVNYIAKWHGGVWDDLEGGMNNVVNAVAVDSAGILYAGGEFSVAGIAIANKIAQWDGLEWNPLGLGVNDWVYTLAVDDADNLYVGGKFSLAGGSTASRIAQWDGNNWNNLGSGMNQTVRALAVDRAGNLYAGGDFTNAGGNTILRIAMWDGSNWSSLGAGMNDSVYALAFDSEGRLYAGGDFTLAGGNLANRIAVWDGSNWSTLDSGTSHEVSALVVDGIDNPVAGGGFSSAGGGTVNNIARWNTGNIYIDGFESGNISAWSGSKGANYFDTYELGFSIPGTLDIDELAICKLCVKSTAAYTGDYGLKVRVPNNKPHYLIDQTPDGESRYRARFYIKVKPLRMGNLNKIKLLQGRDNNRFAFQLLARKKGTKFQIKAAAKLDNGKIRGTKWYFLPKKWVPIEVDWKASTGPGANNGTLSLWVKGNIKQLMGALNNDTYRVESARLGITGKLKSAYQISRFFLLDNFVSNDTYYIGP